MRPAGAGPILVREDAALFVQRELTHAKPARSGVPNTHSMTRLISFRALAVLALAAAPAAAAAQQPAPRALAVGDTLRIVTPNQEEGPFLGVLTAYEWKGMTVRQRGTGVERTIPFADVRGLARSLGVRREHTAWRGARIGAFTLGAVGVVSGPLIATAEAGDRWEIPPTTALTGAAGTLLGGAIGGVLGYTLAREEWQEFRTPIVQVGVGPRGSTVVGVSLTRW